jgi:hypothetical protein
MYSPSIKRRLPMPKNLGETVPVISAYTNVEIKTKKQAGKNRK